MGNQGMQAYDLKQAAAVFQPSTETHTGPTHLFNSPQVGGHPLYVISILNSAAILGNSVIIRAHICPAGPQPWVDQGLQKEELPACLTRQRKHSHSVGIEELTAGRTPPPHADLAQSLSQGKIEHQVTLEELQNLNALFQEHEKRGRQLLDMETFKSIMKQSMKSQNKNIEQIEQLFMKIDYEAVGKIQWDGLCTYLQLEYLKQAKALARQKEVSFLSPAVLRRLSRGGPVLRILSVPDDTLIMIREDGAIYFWSLQLKLKRKKWIFGKSISQKPRWVTDVVSMPQYNKLIIGTGSRELQLYELSNLEPYCQIGSLEAVPLKLDYCSVDPDKCLLVYGDDQAAAHVGSEGKVHALPALGDAMHTACDLNDDLDVGHSASRLESRQRRLEKKRGGRGSTVPRGYQLPTWKKMPKVENMPNITIHYAMANPNVTYIRWKVHGDWVTQLNYYDSMKAIISSSNHEPTALVIGCTMGTTNVKQKMKEIRNVRKDVKTRKGQALPQRRAECDQTVFRIHKGVKAFSFCKRNNLLLTGGMDRIIRAWNPYLPGKPTGVLKSHMAPVIYIHTASEDNKIFSMSTDNTIKIWDLETYSCLFTASSKVSGIKGDLTACLYLPEPQALCVATNAVALLHLRLRPAPEPHLVLSHQDPVVCCKYNPAFRHVVSCSEASMVKIWDFETGRQVSEFTGAHGHAGITCLTFDSSGRRLITGGRDGCLKIWSYNNGHCLHTLKQDAKQSELCDCTYLEVHQNKCIIAVGWDRRINVYFDAPHDFHHFWKPQPHWQDDLNHGHKEDILCVVQCPPFLLATSSYDGEIIIWNVISGHVCCKLNTPSPSNVPDPRKGPDQSVSCLAFLKTRAAKLDTTAASLVANGPGGSVTFWRLFGVTGLFANFTPSRGKAQVSSIAVTAGDALVYLADQQGFVHIYDIKEYGLWGPELQPPKNVTFWRAHVSIVTSLELIEEENFLLSSSLDCTVRLWTKDGVYIGTFGQSNPWDIFTPSSWSHPRVPYEILTDPQSMPTHPTLEGETPAGCPAGREKPDDVTEEKTWAEPGKSSNLCSPENLILEVEKKEEMNQWSEFPHGRLLTAQNKPCWKSPEPGWPSIYQTLRCHEIASVSALGEKPDLSIIGSDLLNVNFLMQEEEASGATQDS
ncbi:uncharacterized protein LOC104862195 [Fukomys damarensis]|uniref:uncharacterized protein LOC104862195 n=1 Tax=Fukomys damarensis TaxID=885580 RepID=UPI00053F7F31|nr:uncharacterized protein LOC104862195 [Fukomys damarensis]